MSGGLAVRANLLCVTWSAARGHVFLFDLEARQRVSAWTLPGSAAGYSDAVGVAMDERFHLFVADPHNGRVRRYSVFGRHLADLGGPAAAGEAGERGRAAAPRAKQGTLERPHAVALHEDTVYVACGEKPLRRGVQRFLRDGTVLRPLLSTGDPEGVFGAPRGVYADAQGILVADTLFGRVQRFRPDGTFVTSIACGNGTVARPVAAVRAANGDILVVDAGDRPGVHAFAPDGAPRGPAADLAARCEAAVAFARDARGAIYVLDRGGERVQRFAPDLSFDAVVVDLAEHLGDYEHGTT